MTVPDIIVLTAAIAFIAACILSEFCADHAVTGLGRFIIRVLTLGRVRLPSGQLDSAGSITAGAATIIFLFLVLLAVKACFT